MDFTDLQTAARRLPARVLHALDADDLPAEYKREFAEAVWQLIDERIHAIVWQGIQDEKILAALQTEYELEPDLDAFEAFARLIELQPDLPERLAAELANIFADLTQNKVTI
jgi:hypothetical protein